MANIYQFYERKSFLTNPEEFLESVCLDGMLSVWLKCLLDTGYEFDFLEDEYGNIYTEGCYINLKAKDLPLGSSHNVLCTCDVCEEIQYDNFCDAIDSKGKGEYRCIMCRQQDSLKGYDVEYRKRYKSYSETKPARTKGFLLTIDEFIAIINSDCFYCGHKPNKKYLNGVDRVDSSYGYHISNCVGCCSICNTMKMDSDVDRFIKKAREIADFCAKKDVSDKAIRENAQLLHGVKSILPKESAFLYTKDLPAKKQGLRGPAKVPLKEKLLSLIRKKDTSKSDFNKLCQGYPAKVVESALIDLIESGSIVSFVKKEHACGRPKTIYSLAK
jgi:hypothetical protein